MQFFAMLLAGIVLVGGIAGVAARSLEAGDEARLTILYTNDTRGYLQTCGCRHSGLGGLDRRATLIRQVRAEQSHVLVLDSGNQAEDAERARVVLQAMGAMGYAAVGVGPLDLKIVDAFWKEAAAAGVPVCVSPPRPAGVPETVPAVLRLEAGGVRVGVVALAPPWPVPAGQGGGGGEGSEEAVWAAVESRLRELRAGSDLVVVLSQRGLASDRALAQRAGRGGASSPPAAGLIDLLIGNAEARSLTAPEGIGRTWLLPTSERGQEVGRVDVTFTATGLQFAWRRIPLDRTFGPEPVVEGIVGAYYAVQAQRLLDASVGSVVGQAGPVKPPRDPEFTSEAAGIAIRHW